MSSSKLVLSGAAGALGGAAEVAEAVSFDGVNDFLSKLYSANGLATSSKTFTFSGWFYWAGNSSQTIFQTPTFLISCNNSVKKVTISGYSDTYATILGYTPTNTIAKNTWNHILVSMDMSDSSKRHVYFNDVADAGSYSSYSNTAIGFGQAGTTTISSGSAEIEGRLAHIYLDTTYRDFSVESNRRLFVTENYKPASGLDSLSPPIYFPLTDASTAGDNSGTTGNFTVNNTLDTAQRGPNQWNCVASDFDGSNDKLTTTSLTGAADGKQAVFSCTFRLNSFNSDPFISFETGGNQRFVIRTANAGSYGYLSIVGQNSSGTSILSFSSTSVKFYLNRTHSLQISFDLADTSKRHVVVDGEEVTGLSWSTYTNDNIDFTVSTVGVGVDGGIGNRFLDGAMGEVYFDDTYIDISTSNPFWDSDASLPKPVRQVLYETSNTPLIALPIQASNEGSNEGTGGNFTVTSGPFTGARGASEYWARSIQSSGGFSNRLSKTVSHTMGQEASLVIAFRENAYFTGDFVIFKSDPLYLHLASHRVEMFVYDSGNSRIWSVSDPDNIDEAKWYIAFVSFDAAHSSASSNTGKVFGNNTVETFSSSYDGAHSVTDTLRAISSITINYQQDNNTVQVGPVYFVDEFIDFSVESNRNLFMDQLGYMKDLTQSIDDGDIPTPLVYMKFNDVDALGTNEGSLGDFTVNGTLTPHSDVDA